MKELMRKEGIWEDLIQELYAAGWDAYRRGLDNKETRRYSAKCFYAFLKAYGFRRYGRHNVRLETPFATAFPYSINDRGIAPGDESPSVYFGTEHLDEKILDYIKKHPEGLTRGRIGGSFQIPVSEADYYLSKLKNSGLITEHSRESIRGRPLNPLFVDASQPAPKKRMVIKVREKRDERIRQAYFLEGKSIKQIAREFHHDRRIIRRAIYNSQMPLQAQY